MSSAKTNSSWDAFRSKPRAVREFKQSSNVVLYALQCIKFIIFTILHAFVVVGAFMSKTYVTALATNLKDRKGPSSVSDEYKKLCDQNVVSVKEHRENELAIIFALLCIQGLPDIIAILNGIYRQLKYKSRNKSIALEMVACEFARSLGLSLLFFYVFPEMDFIRSTLFMCASLYLEYLFVAIDQIKVSFKLVGFYDRCFKLLTSLGKSIKLCLILSSAYVWILIDFNYERFLALPVGSLLFAVGHWESWVGMSHSRGMCSALFQYKYGLRKPSTVGRIVIGIVRLSPLVIVCFCVTSDKNIQASEVYGFLFTHKWGNSTRETIFMAICIVVINFLMRCSVQFLATMKVRLLTLIHPTLITAPILSLISTLSCNYAPFCFGKSFLEPYALNIICTRWHPPLGSPADYLFLFCWGFIYVEWAYSYISGSKFRKIDEIIDTMPMFLNGFTVEHSLVVYRYAIGKKEVHEELEDEPYTEGKLRLINNEIDKAVTLYVCATMWHETSTEMTQMIKSILKLDEEHAIRLAEKRSKDTMKFSLEVHIFFDDAWCNDPEVGRVPNEYFRTFYEVFINCAGNLENSAALDPRTRVLANTSYGGRLVIRLPAGTLLFVHLKDKILIRHKKRWSQVMYMYYLLGHRIMDSHLSIEDRQLQADNTYVLAIDGDSKFEPDAVIKLLHLMNTKSDIGCACGRIHPIGEGIMVWYQKFEYAIAHWFQKAAEHVFGCVLCAPGCFSLFRASALMDDNIMHKYTKTAVEPRHFVQYDQGEDRWLSTLMLKQGYRIEYAAGADAETYAPEGFEEFFNQRRRWTPSSVANTIDLLADYKLASQNNASISKLYILYQMIVIGFSILGPAIIFTMLVYAQVAAFEIDSSKVLIYNAVPTILFIVSCFTVDSSIQLVFAKVASIVYAFIMLAVLIATSQQIVLETIFSPTSAFVLTMVLIFLVSSFMHPKEFSNILFGCIFFLMIPSTYIYLSLYSLINLNVINWGTREAVAQAIGRPVDREAIGERWLRQLGLDNDNHILYRLIPCFRTPSVQSDKLRALERKIERTERLIKEFKADSDGAEVTAISLLTIFDREERKQALSGAEVAPRKRINLNNSGGNQSGGAVFDGISDMWMDLEYLQGCDRGRLKQSEERFWDQLIAKYLTPLESSPKEQKENAEGLANLRNRIAFSIIVLNGLLVLAIFLLQRHKETLSIKMVPYEGFVWTKLNETTGKFEKTTEALKVDPLGVLIICFLMGILIVQTVGMIIHRLNTIVEALHEVNELDEVHGSTTHIKSKFAILTEARQMLDMTKYDDAHGADGYVRSGKMEQKALNNVLYKLERQDETNPKMRRTRIAMF